METEKITWTEFTANGAKAVERAQKKNIIVTYKGKIVILSVALNLAEGYGEGTYGK